MSRADRIAYALIGLLVGLAVAATVVNLGLWPHVGLGLWVALLVVSVAGLAWQRRG